MSTAAMAGVRGSGHSQECRAADSVVDILVSEGVDTFFGVPGGPVSPVFDAILHNSRARLVESRHESGAAFAACGYHRTSGRVPCVVVTAGPGVTNAVTGVASAYYEGVPMVVLSGDVSWSEGGRKLLQDCGPAGLDAESMLRSVTRSRHRVGSPRTAASYAAAAFHSAVSMRGPSLLVLPIQHGSAPAHMPEVAVSRRPPSVPDVPVVQRALSGLLQARRPLVVVGAACRPFAEELREFFDRVSVPFVTTPRAKGIVSEGHPMSLRSGGLAASAWARRYTSPGVDFCLVLGTDLDDCSVGGLRYVSEDGELFHVDSDPEVFGRNVPASVGVCCDVGEFVRTLLSVSSSFPPLLDPLAEEVAALRSTSAFDVQDFRSRQDVSPYRILADLERTFPDARFVTDIGEHMLFALHYLTAGDPGAFSINLGLGSMGSGICGAVGSAIGDPSRTVVCVCGDGGMQMFGMEALVAVRESLPVVFAVFNDGRYNMVYHGHKQVYGFEHSWDSPGVDFAAWARSIGIPSRRIESAGTICPELLGTMPRGRGPLLLDIRVDPSIRMVGGGRNEALMKMSMPEAGK